MGDGWGAFDFGPPDTASTAAAPAAAPARDGWSDFDFPA